VTTFRKARSILFLLNIKLYRRNGCLYVSGFGQELEVSSPAQAIDLGWQLAAPSIEERIIHD